MYGETGAAMRAELAALLRQHRIQQRRADFPPSLAAVLQEKGEEIAHAEEIGGIDHRAPLAL